MSTIKREIAGCALNLIRRKSFSSFSYDDISREFNMTKAAVHYHFRSKEDLGVAVCDALMEGIEAGRAAALDEAAKGRHPWLIIEDRIKAFSSRGICPIASLLADFHNLPERLREALTRLTRAEVEFVSALVRAYDPGADVDAAAALYVGLKSVRQYRRAMGDDFCEKTLKSVKKQFYALLPGRRRRGSKRHGRDCAASR